VSTNDTLLAVEQPEPVEAEPAALSADRTVPVRSAVGSAIMLVAILAVTLFAVPLAVAAARLYEDEAFGRLSGEASRGAGYLSGDALRPGRPPGAGFALPPVRHAGVGLSAYRADGVRLVGSGPARSGLAVRVASDRDEEQDLSGGDLEVAVPVRADGPDVVVRAALPYSNVLDRTWITFGVMAGLAVAVLAFSWTLARRRAARIAAPLEEMTRVAHALGSGDFAIEPGPAAIYEAAEAGRALQATARRLGALLEQARSAAADASHQVRTPLTALRLGLERVLLTPDADRDTAIREALQRAERVEATITEVLARSRDPLAPVEPIDVGAVMVAARADRWGELAGEGRRTLDLVIEPSLPPAAATTAVLNQVLDVLVTNALDHGAGTVTVATRTAGGGVAVDVRDEGEGFDAEVLDGAFRRRDPRARGNGIGLALARNLAESIGARLIVADPGPYPVVTLLLPQWSAAGYSSGG
jgi:signal transduction histidine kinase